MAIDDGFNKAQYNAHCAEYLDTNMDQHIGGGNSEERVALLQQFLSTGSKIFEIGSGGGDDAVALKAVGCDVTASDLSDEFVKILQSKGLRALLFDAKKDDIPNSVDAIYANAVFVHFAPDELRDFLRNAKKNLTGSKLIFFSVIAGNSQERRAGSTISFERDFQDYSRDMIQRVVDEAEYRIVHSSLVDQRWYQIVAECDQ